MTTKAVEDKKSIKDIKPSGNDVNQNQSDAIKDQLQKKVDIYNSMQDRKKELTLELNNLNLSIAKMAGSIEALNDIFNANYSENGKQPEKTEN